MGGGCWCIPRAEVLGAFAVDGIPLVDQTVPCHPTPHIQIPKVHHRSDTFEWGGGAIGPN